MSDDKSNNANNIITSSISDVYEKSMLYVAFAYTAGRLSGGDPVEWANEFLEHVEATMENSLKANAERQPKPDKKGPAAVLDSMFGNDDDKAGSELDLLISQNSAIGEHYRRIISDINARHIPRRRGFISRIIGRKNK